MTNQTMRQRSQLVQAAERGIHNEQRYKRDRVVFWGAVALLVILGAFG